MVSWRDFTVATGYRPQIACDVARSAAACRAAARLAPYRTANAATLSRQVCAALEATATPGSCEDVVLGALLGALRDTAGRQLSALESAAGRLLGLPGPMPLRTGEAQHRALAAATGDQALGACDPVAALLDRYPHSPTAEKVVQSRVWVDFLTAAGDGRLRAALATSYQRGRGRAATSERTQVEETARAVTTTGIDGVALLEAVVRFESLKHYRLVWLRVDRTISAGTYDDVHPDDLFSHGYLGLLRALHRYDPSREAFSTYAMYRINGAIRDGMRAESPIPKRASTQLRKVKDAVDVLTQRLQRAPTPGEVADAVDLSLAKLEELQRLQAPRPLTEPAEDDDTAERNPTTHLADPTPDPSALVEGQALAEELRTAVAALPEQQRAAVELLVLEERTLSEASARTGMTTSVLRRAKRDGIGELRDVLAGWR